jgi:hypothetical protein
MQDRNASWSAWYKKNSQKYNAQRKARYHTDPEYREKIQTIARESKRVRTAKLEGSVFRVWDGKRILVHRIGAIAVAAGVNVDFIRRLEENGTIPKPSFSGTQRVYTQSQADLIRTLAYKLKTTSSRKLFASICSQESIKIKAQWLKEI